jgi:hypothetical protein
VAMHLHPSRLEERRLRLCELKLHDATLKWSHLGAGTKQQASPPPHRSRQSPTTAVLAYCRDSSQGHAARINVECRSRCFVESQKLACSPRSGDPGDSSRFVLHCCPQPTNASTQVRAPTRARAQRERSRTRWRCGERLCHRHADTVQCVLHSNLRRRSIACLCLCLRRVDNHLALGEPNQNSVCEPPGES